MVGWIEQSRCASPLGDRIVSLPPRFIRLSCAACQQTETITWEDWLTSVRGRGKFRRNAVPSWDEVQAIVQVDPMAAGSCSECGQWWSRVEPWTPLDDFETTRKCDVCESVIDSERLEALPDTDLCRKCAAHGKSAADYCPLCGAVTRWDRKTSGNRYRQCCDACGWAG